MRCRPEGRRYVRDELGLTDGGGRTSVLCLRPAAWQEATLYRGQSTRGRPPSPGAGRHFETDRTNPEMPDPAPQRPWFGIMPYIACGINTMELFRRTGRRVFQAFIGATNKATMCFEINRCANYVPIPKQMLCTPYQGFRKPKITGFGLGSVSNNMLNQQHAGISVDNMPRFSGGPAAYEQSHDVS